MRNGFGVPDCFSLPVTVQPPPAFFDSDSIARVGIPGLSHCSRIVLAAGPASARAARRSFQPTLLPRFSSKNRARSFASGPSPAARSTMARTIMAFS